MATSGPTTKDTSTVALGLAQIRVGNSAANIASTTAVLAAGNSIGALGETNYTGNVEYWKLESGFPALEDLTIPLRESSMLAVTYKEITPFNVALARGIDPTADVDGTVIEGDAVSTSGTTTGDIAVTKTVLNEITDTWTVVFTGATAGDIFGATTGYLESFTAVDTAITPLHDSNKEYFTIPAAFFSGTWADTDSFTFATTASVAGTAAYANTHSGSIKLGALSAPAFVRMESYYVYPDKIHTMNIIFPRANITGNTELSMQAEDAVSAPMVFEAKRADSGVSGGDAAWDAMPLGTIFWT